MFMGFYCFEVDMSVWHNLGNAAASAVGFSSLSVPGDRALKSRLLTKKIQN